jgi:hypothetical protein
MAGDEKVVAFEYMAEAGLESLDADTNGSGATH